MLTVNDMHNLWEGVGGEGREREGGGGGMEAEIET